MTGMVSTKPQNPSTPPSPRLRRAGREAPRTNTIWLRAKLTDFARPLSRVQLHRRFHLDDFGSWIGASLGFGYWDLELPIYRPVHPADKRHA